MTWYGRAIAIFQYSDASGERQTAVFLCWFKRCKRCTARPTSAAAATGMLRLAWETTHLPGGIDEVPWCAVVDARSVIEPVFVIQDDRCAAAEEGWLAERFFLNHHVRG